MGVRVSGRRRCLVVFLVCWSVLGCAGAILNSFRCGRPPARLVCGVIATDHHPAWDGY